MNIQRLQMLAELLDKVKPDSFNISFWIANNNCGTVACAVGHACMHRPFNEMGLTLLGASPQFIIDGKAIKGWSAVYQFFDIDIDTADHLFFVNAYPQKERTPAHVVAARIRAVIAKEQKQ